MSTKDNADPRLEQAWIDMAEHFLDTETRHTIPRTALSCLSAGLSVNLAHQTWRCDVVPVVGHNVLDIAGEWALWPTEWLLPRVCANHQAPPWSRRLRAVAHGLEASVLDGVWRSIALCMTLLEREVDVDRRETLTRDLEALCRHHFDFAPRPVDSADGTRARLRALYPEPFLALVTPATLAKHLPESDRRVRCALGLER